MTDHESRLDQELQATLRTQRLACLGTLAEDGSPFVTMVQYALEPVTGRLVLHLSAQTPSVTHMNRDGRVSLLVLAPEGVPGDEASRPRITLQGRAVFPDIAGDDWQVCRAAYLQRFPEHEPMTQMLDLAFVAISIGQARQVSGYGAARGLAGESVVPLLVG